MCKSAQGKPIIMLDGSTVGKTVMEMEGSDRFKEYLKGQITELGDGLDMGAMNDFWFLACISDRMERPVTELGSLEKVQEIQRDQEPISGPLSLRWFWHIQDMCIALMKPCV